MDVTPNKKMFEAMVKFVDSTIGEAPGKLETTAGAMKRREARERAFDFLHGLVRLSMREGIGRYLKDQGQLTVEDQVRPNPLKVVPPSSDIIHTR